MTSPTKQIIEKFVQQMVYAGVHFGHQRRQLNPKMASYIYTEKDNLQIIDLFKTYCYLKKSYIFLFNECSKGKRVLFIGTKKHVAKCIEQIAIDCDSWYINKRWSGGFLTNWETMRKSILKIQKKDAFISKSKKENARINRQKKHLLKYLSGVKTMFKLPDIIIIVGQQKEMNAVKECQKLKIPSLTILDTNCDPALTDYFIPANDDSVASVNFILTKLGQAIKKGRAEFQKKLYNKKK